MMRRQHETGAAVPEQGQARCGLCGLVVAVDEEGRCALGHLVAVPPAGAQTARVDSGPFPASPPAPEPAAEDPFHHPYDDVLGWDRVDAPEPVAPAPDSTADLPAGAAFDDLLAWDDQPSAPPPPAPPPAAPPPAAPPPAAPSAAAGPGSADPPAGAGLDDLLGWDRDPAGETVPPAGAGPPAAGEAGAQTASPQPPAPPPVAPQLDELLRWDAVDAASALDLAAEDLSAEQPPPAPDATAVPAEPDAPREQRRTRQRALGLLAGLLALGLAVVGALQLAL